MTSLLIGLIIAAFCFGIWKLGGWLFDRVVPLDAEIWEIALFMLLWFAACYMVGTLFGILLALIFV